MGERMFYLGCSVFLHNCLFALSKEGLGFYKFVNLTDNSYFIAAFTAKNANTKCKLVIYTKIM